ncbi:hypothetical protein Taro_000971 [Colocasia esculenta]|uniref:Uncharacterized protein n=1 Tax=Colocasia esculenta TaxID=4460 RepID=A0A843TGP2_COLES|nr:hypothetical protein [Colocasia esculenta]
MADLKKLTCVACAAEGVGEGEESGRSWRLLFQGIGEFPVGSRRPTGGRSEEGRGDTNRAGQERELRTATNLTSQL